MTKTIAALSLIAALACSLRIPNRITPEEHGVYADWMNFHFSKDPPVNLHLQSSTVAFHPPSDGPCGQTDLREAGVPGALINQLLALGTAEYRLEVFTPDTKLAVPWSYKVFDARHPAESEHQQTGEYGDMAKQRYRLLEFSRVAFDRAHNKAFFYVSDTCGTLCGMAVDIYAHKESGGWVFSKVGCEMMY
jgi:hypothetical protein